MSIKTNGGGPAFPSDCNELEGMSLRDWFAGMVLPVLAATPDGSIDGDAKTAYAFADAMLAERNKP